MRITLINDMTYGQLLQRHDLVEIYDNHKGVQEYYGFKGKRKILVKSEQIDVIEKIKNNHSERIKSEIDRISHDLYEEIKSKGFMIWSDFKDALFKKAPPGYKNKIDYDGILKRHDLIHVLMEDYLEDFIKMGVNPSRFRKRILIENSTYNKLAK